MKRKKWSEKEEQTLITKYSDLLNSGTLTKLKTREKKFKPIADHVNSVHHLTDPITYPFRWSWRDVSIKVQNMRHQYLGVKQKIRVSDGEFNWDDGENHWENFLRYKEVFGDVEIESKEKRCDWDFELGLGIDDDDDDGDEDDEEDEDEDEEDVIEGEYEKSSKKRRIALLGARVLELRNVLVRREEKGREREFTRDEAASTREEVRRDVEVGREERGRGWEERVEERELELEETRAWWGRREVERRLRFERELDEARRWRMRMEEKREEEEMEWREKMLGMQIEHEKQMMQLHADACQNQMQVLGVMARVLCQFFGSPTDGLGAGLGGLTPQVLQNLQHTGPGDLVGDSSKPGTNSPPEFM